MTQPQSTVQPSQPTAPATEVPLEADEAVHASNITDDGDSAYGSAVTDTTSVMSSIFNYRVENGRTYHSYKADSRAYWAPNDELENERLDLIHNVCVKLLGGKLYLSPIGKGKPIGRVLDAGCGTGAWAMDFADEHPEAQVVGVDLSPIQPHHVPTNVEWFVDDLEAEWTYHTPFDFVYVRMMVGAIRDWPKLFQQAFEHMNPGGWIEIYESRHPVVCQDGTLPPDSAMLKWSKLCFEASVKMGTPMDSALYHKQRLLDAGFVNVVHKELAWPSNSWPKDKDLKEIGAWCYEAAASGLEAMSLMLFTTFLGWTAEEVQVFLVQVRKELKDPRIHAYWPVACVYGQKPE